MRAVTLIGTALVPLTEVLASAFSQLVTAMRRGALLWELDCSQKFCDVLTQRIADATIAMREYPLYQVQLQREIRKHRAALRFEQENLFVITSKLELLA